MTARSFRFVVPEGWHEVPAAAEDHAPWAQSIAAAVAEACRPELEADLVRLAARRATDPRGTRRHFAQVPDDIARRATAHLTVDAYAAADDGLEAYLSAVEEAQRGTEPSPVVAQRVERVLVPAGPAAVVQDYLAQPDGSLQERYLAALFPPESGLLVELQLTTPDLARFPDIVDYGDRILATVEVEG